MKEEKRNVAGLILMGGLNSRMGGEKKALLTYRGRHFYECVKEAMVRGGVTEIYASVEKRWEMELGIPQIIDRYEKIGPLGGILSALTERAEKASCIEEAGGLLVLPCDIPRVSEQMVMQMIKAYRECEQEMPVVVSAEGHANPLLAIYTKACIPVLQEQISEGNYKARLWMEKVPYKRLSLEETGISADSVANVNNKEDFRKLS